MPPLIDPSWEYGYDVDPEIAEILAENAGRGAEEWFGGTAAGFHVGFRSRFREWVTCHGCGGEFVRGTTRDNLYQKYCSYPCFSRYHKARSAETRRYDHTLILSLYDQGLYESTVAKLVGCSLTNVSWIVRRAKRPPRSKPRRDRVPDATTRELVTLDQAKALVRAGVMVGTVLPFLPEADRPELKRWFCYGV